MDPAYVLRELPSRLDLAERTVGEVGAIEVDLDHAPTEMSADELLRERILDIALNGAPERPRAVRAVLAGDLDNPVNHLGGQRDRELAIDQVVVQLMDQQRHDPPQVIVCERLEDD